MEPRGAEGLRSMGHSVGALGREQAWAGEPVCSTGRPLSFSESESLLYNRWGTGLGNLKLRLLFFADYYSLSVSFVPRTQY